MRKIFIPSAILLLTLMLTTFFSCKKKPDDNPTERYMSEVYQPNAQALVGSTTDTQNGDKVYYYGSWNTDNTVAKYSAIVIQKGGSDTTSTFQLNASGDSIVYAYFSVGNQLQNKLYTFEKLGSTELMINIFDYNWVANTGTFDRALHIKDGMVLKTDETDKLLSTNGLLPAISPEVKFVATVLAGAVVIGAVAAACPVCAVVGVMGGVIAGSANASEQIPVPNIPIPTQQQQPNVPQTPNCTGVTINFNANMDSQGSIAVFGLSGGAGGYKYSLQGGPFQTSQFFIGNRPAGNYSVTVKDSMGCSNTKTFNLSPSNTINDGDGNQYQTVTIGTQTWLTENLHTSRYMNGDTIATYTSNLEWSTATTGAWCYYGNDPQYDATYGKLYNWYTVTDSRKVCPTGYHIPTEAECVTLFNNASNIALRATAGWTYSANSIPTNTSGFTALPAGQRYGGDGTFHDILDMTVFWTATQDTANATQAKVMWLPYAGGGGAQGTNAKTNGISVRCIKD